MEQRLSEARIPDHNKLKSIAFITPKIDTFSNPTLVLLFEELIEKEYKILFFGFDQLFIPKEIINKLEFHELPFNFFSFFRRSKSYRRPFDVLKMIKQYYELFRLFKIKNKVKAIICVDPMGLVYGGRIKKIINIKIVYTSFEIFFEEEFYEEEKKRIKLLERIYSNAADLVVIQDEVREELLRSGNNFCKEVKFVHIPVAPKQFAVSKNNHDIYSELGIPGDKMIVVYSGNLQRWSGINEILDLFPDKWNNDFWFVIHSHYILPEGDQLRLRMSELKKSKMNISFHNKPFYDYKDYYEFLSGCHIGIAIYFPNTIDFFAGKNIIEIGLSSGKFSTYMMLGIPAITTSNYIYTKLNKIYDFGVTITNVDEISAGLENIKIDYLKKKAGCKKIFENELDPVTKLAKLINEIEEYYK